MLPAKNVNTYVHVLPDFYGCNFIFSLNQIFWPNIINLNTFDWITLKPSPLYFALVWTDVDVKCHSPGCRTV